MKLSPWAYVIGLFAIIALTSDFLFTRWAIYNNPSSNAGRIYHLIQEQGDEIPILGSSKVYYDYIPSKMGINAYNYGLDGASYEVTDTFLQIELAKHKTSPIIVDLKPESEHGIGDPSTFIPFVFDSRIRGLLNDTASMAWRFRLPGLRYFGYYDYYLKELLNDRAHLMRTVERGFSNEKYWTFDRARLDRAVRLRMQGPNGYFPDAQQNHRLIDHIKQHPERLFLLVYSPVHSSCFVNFHDREGFEAFKAELASLPNALVIDWQQSNYPDEWFKDTNHLLYEGAVDFSTRLGAKIREVLRARGALGSVGAGPHAPKESQHGFFDPTVK